jgi:hypothetical protein
MKQNNTPFHTISKFIINCHTCFGINNNHNQVLYFKNTLRKITGIFRECKQKQRKPNEGNHLTGNVKVIYTKKQKIKFYSNLKTLQIMQLTGPHFQEYIFSK